MHPHIAPGTIRPKISTMPRQKTEAAALLDLYKLAIEKKRLQQELHSMEARREQIQQRLLVLDRQVAGLEVSIEHLRQDHPAAPVPFRAQKPVTHPATDTFDMQFLDY